MAYSVPFHAPSATSKDTVIIGAGIAGLALALNLHARGIHTRIFEAAPSLREMGVGITLLPHAVRELTALGLVERIAAQAIENRESAFFNRFGQRIYDEPRGKLAGYPYPEFGIHRGKLHMTLYEAVRERLGPDAVTCDMRCISHEQDDEGVTLFFRRNDGTAASTIRALAAVACDGINSAIRKAYYPEETVKFSGINTWRGVTRMKPILDGRTYMRVGSIRTGKIVIYPIVDNIDGSDNQLVNWMAEIETAGEGTNDWNKAVGFEAVLPLFREWRFDWLDVPEMIRNADAIFEYPMVDKDPIDRWTFGRATFAGDAAHPMYPRGSNGSAQALIDARTLADYLGKISDPRQAFLAYEETRREVTAKIVQTNRTNPPDIINIRVEELTGDKPFDNLESFIKREELKALSDNYKRIAGFALKDLAQ
ncbi:MAG: binding domain protein [Bradyrhizobium sp.]|jgi:2-polyprenyl-6-methoxyphenol hydroxylase-like FAD-dependent oxidoreductase|nr:binding domain protein [Bradyrhizobium sp.]